MSKPRPAEVTIPLLDLFWVCFFFLSLGGLLGAILGALLVLPPLEPTHRSTIVMPEDFRP